MFKKHFSQEIPLSDIFPGTMFFRANKPCHSGVYWRRVGCGAHWSLQTASTLCKSLCYRWKPLAPWAPFIPRTLWGVDAGRKGGLGLAGSQHLMDMWDRGPVTTRLPDWGRDINPHNLWSYLNCDALRCSAISVRLPGGMPVGNRGLLSFCPIPLLISST